MSHPHVTSERLKRKRFRSFYAYSNLLSSTQKPSSTIFGVCLALHTFTILAFMCRRSGNTTLASRNNIQPCCYSMSCAFHVFFCWNHIALAWCSYRSIVTTKYPWDLSGQPVGGDWQAGQEIVRRNRDERESGSY